MSDNLQLLSDVAIMSKKLSVLKREAKAQAKTDASFVAEIRNSLKREFHLDLEDPGSKVATLLRDWEAELMKKAGFRNRAEMRKWHAKHVGAQNW